MLALGPDVVTSVGSYLTEDGPVSESGQAALLPVLMTETDEDALADDAKLLDEAVTSVDRPEGFETHVAGPATLFNQFNEIIEEDIAKGEGIGSIVALIVLLVVLGSVVAGLIPLVLAAFSIAIAMGATALAGQVVDFSFFVQNMITMIGLAVGIDYSLFIVARYREERLHGREKLEAIGRAGATANRAVFFSGMTVVLALLGLLIVPNTIFRSLAGGAIIVVLVAVAASMTLLPAILALLGDRINALRVRKNAGRVEAGTGFWDSVTRLVMRRPVISLVAGAGLMIVLAIPYFSIHTGTSGVSTLPDDIEGKRAFVLLEENFAGGLSEPAEIVIDGDIASSDIQSAIDELTATVATDDAFAPASPLEVNDAGDLAVLSVPFRGDIYEDVSVQAIRDLREEYVPDAFAGTDARVLVGGETAFNVDFFNQSDTYMPIVFVFVLGLSFILLTVVFRSVVLPVKAILMNLLSVGAAYGMVVMFFQEGVGPPFVKDIAEALNFIQVESIEAWIPLFLFSVLFGLSMDYHVFLLTRIREHFDRTGDNTESVAYGLRTTAGIITGAALIMVAVFARVRRGPALTAPADGVRPGGRGLPGRHDRADGPGSVGDEAPRQCQLVPAELAGVAAEARCRRTRGRGAPRGDPGFAGGARRGRREPGRGRASSERRRQSGSRERVFSLSSSRRTSRAIHRADAAGISRIRSASSMAAPWSARFRFPICLSAHDTPFLTSLRGSSAPRRINGK